MDYCVSCGKPNAKYCRTDYLCFDCSSKVMNDILELEVIDGEGNVDGKAVERDFIADKLKIRKGEK